MGSSQDKCEDDEIEIEKDPDSSRFWHWFDGYRPKSYQTLQEVKQTLIPGDMVSVKRGYIEHFMVYIGNDYCVHFYAAQNSGKKSNIKSIMDYLSQQISIVPNKWADQMGVVALEKIESIIGNDKCRIDNRINQVTRGHGVRKRRKNYKIVEEARRVWESAQSSPLKYNISSYNCETFALELRYGVRITSEQVRILYHDEL